MIRISIDVTAEEHQRLKAMAALQGKTIKGFVRELALGEIDDEEAASKALVAVLEKRIESARAGHISKRSVEQIFEAANRKCDADRVDG